MREDFLHYIWQFQVFRTFQLLTAQNEKIHVLSVGEANTNSGPDFFNSKIKINNTIWAGNIEIHVNASDWNKHGHQDDPAYNNVILHVVYSNNVTVLTNVGLQIPTLELKGIIDTALYENYRNLIKSKTWIPCEKLIKGVNGFTINNWLDRLIIERLERKSNEIKDVLKGTNNDWAETFYIQMAKNFGFSINKLPFQLLAKATPIRILHKHKDSLFQIEALLLGQAGMLNKDFKDKYPNDLKREYEFLKHKYQLVPIKFEMWKYLRIRPANFPSLRIAQFAMLIHQSNALFSQILELENLSEIKQLLTIKLSNYWLNHYQFDKPTEAKNQRELGKESINTILINTLIPFLFSYGREKQSQRFIDRSMYFLQQIKAENNAIINRWEQIGLKINSAYASQGLLELKTEYCHQKKCLKCAIGNKILKQ